MLGSFWEKSHILDIWMSEFSCSTEKKLMQHLQKCKNIDTTNCYDWCKWAIGYCAHIWGMGFKKNLTQNRYLHRFSGKNKIWRKMNIKLLNYYDLELGWQI